jgi:alpha-beta hydrolase superfamily lysophospholipase
MSSDISSYLFINNIRLHYQHWNRGSGRPVILLHGLASNLLIWDLTIPHLTEAGLEPFAWDARGHGLSDGPDGDYGFETYLADLGAFLETCQVEHPLIVGHSWGAALTLAFAARNSFGPRPPAHPSMPPVHTVRPRLHSPPPPIPPSTPPLACGQVSLSFRNR